MNAHHCLVLTALLAVGSTGAASAQTPTPSPAAAPTSLLGSGWGAEHLIVMSKEIEATRSAFAALGFTTTPPTSVSKVLFHSIVRFPDGTYLELTQFFRDPKLAVKESTSGHKTFIDRYAAFVQKREGAKHLGIAVKPASQTVSFLRARGFEVADPIGDNTEWEEGRSPTPEWYAVDFTKPKGLTESLSFIEYVNADKMAAQLKENVAKGVQLTIEDHLNTAMGISEVWIAVRDLESQAQLMEKLGFTRGAPIDKPHVQAKGIRFGTSRASIVLMSPGTEPKGILGDWMKKNGEGIFGARIVVLDLKRALTLIRERHRDKKAVITSRGEKGGRGFVIDGAFAGGLTLEIWAND